MRVEKVDLGGIQEKWVWSNYIVWNSQRIKVNFLNKHWNVTSYHWDVQSYHCPRILWSWKCSWGWDNSVGNGPPEQAGGKPMCWAWSPALTPTALWWRRWDPWGKLARLNWAEVRREICQSLTSKCTYTLPQPQPTNVNTHRMLKEQSKKYLLLWLKKTHFSQYWGKVEEKQRKDLCEAL